MTDKRLQYVIDIQKTGLSNLNQVIVELDKAGVETSEFKRQAEQLARQLADMERQQGLIGQFVRLKQETVEAGQAFAAAQAKAQQMGKELAAIDAPTKKQTAEFERARAAVNSTKDAYQAAQVRLQSMRGTLADNNIETAGLAQKQAALRNGIKDVEAQVKTATTRLTEMGAQAPKALNDTGSAAKTASGEVDKLATVSEGLKSKLTGVAAAVTGLFAAAKLKDYALDAIATADAYGQMTERIKMATPIAEEYAVVQKRILEAANLTYRPLHEQQTLYIETADALRELGYTTQQALDIQDSFTYLLTTNAASAEKGQSAIDAYTKSINSGRVEVDAWQSLLAATPTVIDAVAAATGKTTGEVRQLGITGKLSIADLNEGLRLSVDRNKQLAAGMSATVKDAVQRLSNTWQAYIGEANKANQTTAGIVKTVDMLSSNLDGVVKAATLAGEVMVAVWGFKALAALKSYVAQLRLAATETTVLMSTTSTAGAKMAAALSAAGKLAAAGWIGWEIGTFLRTEFEVVEKAGIALSAQLTKGAALVQGSWEMVKAAFTDDTIEAASERMEQRLREIDDIYSDMFANVGKAAQAQNSMAAATTASGNAAENAKVKWEQYRSAFEVASEKLELQSKQVQAMVALRNAEAEGVALIAKEMGTEKEARQAAADAAAVQAEQAKALAVQAGKELEAVRNHRDELLALGAEVLKNDPVRQKQLDQLNTEVAVRESAAGQAIAHARALEVSAVAAKADATAVEDNSAKVKELGAEYEQARRDLDLLRNLQAAGIKTQQDVTYAENALVKASKEYKDALADQEGLIRSRTSAELAGIDVKSAGINLAIEQQRSILAVAKASGDEALAMQAENKIRQLQIELLLLTAKAKDAEAKSALALIEVKRAELISSGQLTEAKRLELDAATKAAQVKQMEAKIARETADGLQRLGQVRQGSKADIDAETDALSRLNGERERELDNIVKRDNMGHETRTAGNALGNRQGIIEWLKGAGLDEVVAEYISRDFVDAKGNAPYMGNGGVKKWGGGSISTALSKAVDFYRYGDGKATAEMLEAEAKKEKDAKEAKSKTTTAPSPAPTSSPAPAPGSSGSASSGVTYVSNYNFPDQRVRVSYADSNSQQEMDAFLRRLYDDKRLSQ